MEALQIGADKAVPSVRQTLIDGVGSSAKLHLRNLVWCSPHLSAEAGSRGAGVLGLPHVRVHWAQVHVCPCCLPRGPTPCDTPHSLSIAVPTSWRAWFLGLAYG